MRDITSLQKEDSFLVLDIYLGGVGGAIVKNGVIKNSAHHKTIIPSENTVPSLLTQVEPLLKKTLEDLIYKNKVTKAYIFVDAPLSCTESAKLIYQKDDVSFFDTKSKEIENILELPISYKAVLGNYSQDGVVFEHPPQKHTINGYTTTNLKLDGIREALVSQQWIQREVYNAIENAKRIYQIGELIFLPEIQNINNNVFMLGDVVSNFAIANKNILIGTGSIIAIMECADTNNHSVSQIESVLKSVARDHCAKNFLYKTILSKFTQSTLAALKQEGFVDNTPYSCVYVGDVSIFPVVENAFSSFKNIHFTDKYTDSNARLSYILKNKVQ